MEQLLTFLTKYGLFIGIVIGTIVLFWAVYAIYNAIGRSKGSKKSHQPKPLDTQNSSIPVQDEKSPSMPTIRSFENDTPSLEGDNVIKTGPRKMSMASEDDDDDNEDRTPTPIKSEESLPVVAEKELDVQLTTNHIEISPTSSDKGSVEPSESLTKPEETPIPLENKEAPQNLTIHDTNQTLLAKQPKEYQKISLHNENVQTRPLPPVETEIPVKKTAKSETKKVNAEPKVIKVNTLSPKPKKKVPPKFHVLFRATDNTWYVKVEGNDSIIATLETQREAISYATIKALKSDSVVIVHRKDGKIRKQATMQDVIDSDEDE